MGERASYRTMSRRFISWLDIHFSRVATSGSNKINLNPILHPIHFPPAKLAIPSNPHLLIIALSCMFKNQLTPLSRMLPSHTSSHAEPSQTSQPCHIHPGKERKLTGCREHLFASEHRVRSCHKAHHLFRLAQRLSSSSEADDRLGKDDSGSCNRPEHTRERYRLTDPISTTSQSRAQR